MMHAPQPVRAEERPDEEEQAQEQEEHGRCSSYLEPVGRCGQAQRLNRTGTDSAHTITAVKRLVDTKR